MSSCIKNVFYAFHLAKLIDEPNNPSPPTLVQRVSMSCVGLIPVMGPMIYWIFPSTITNFPPSLSPAAKIRSIVTAISFGLITVILDIIVELGVLLYKVFKYLCSCKKNASNSPEIN